MMAGKISRRDFVLRLTAAGLSMTAIGGLLAACASPGSSTTGSKPWATDPKSLSGTIKLYKGPFAANEPALQQAYIDSFKSVSPNVAVQFSAFDWTQATAQMTAALASGSQDVIYIPEVFYGAFPWSTGPLENLEPWVQDPAFTTLTQNFLPGYATRPKPTAPGGILGGVAWIGSHDLDPAKPLASDTPPLEIQGVSLDWKWLFIYPDQRVASVNQLVVPASVPLHFSLTSASVMNAFFIPQLGSMIYTMNGMTTQLHLQADAPGTFRGLSSHYSGDGFSGMHFEVRAVPPEQFDAWIEDTRKTGPTLDPASYAELTRQSMNTRPFTFRTADPALFEQIVTEQLPPGPGPQTGRPHPSVSPRTEH